MGFYAEYIFPRILDWTLQTDYIQALRRKTLAPARGQVLEIGFGTGLNLPHYPPEVDKLTVLDSERMLPSRVAQRISEARFRVEQVKLDASRRMPFGDSSFDSVVTTLTLCSISDVDSALSEIHRVLKPEGSYLFLEHGRSDDSRVARWQDRLNPLQRIVACGCNLNRRIDSVIERAGFVVTTLERFVMPDAPRMMSEMYQGEAKVK
jgi:ubiquinone/menaquinone biosynthesis C-methylase UbiE